MVLAPQYLVKMIKYLPIRVHDMASATQYLVKMMTFLSTSTYEMGLAPSFLAIMMDPAIGWLFPSHYISRINNQILNNKCP